MKIIISGHRGYLGSNILSHLRKKDNTISLLERTGEGVKNDSCPADVFFYMSNPNEINFQKDSHQALKDMKKHFLFIKEILHKTSPTHIIYASSIRVHDLTKTPYAKAHLEVEDLLENLCLKTNLSLTKCRFSNIFGGTLTSMIKRDTLIPHSFIKEAITNGSISLLSTGQQLRDFTPMSLVLKYIDHIISVKPKYIDICSGVNMKVIEIANLIKQELPLITINVSTKKKPSSQKGYSPTLPQKKDFIESEVKHVIHQWKNYYDNVIG